jgi:hypothetical protein
VKEIWTIAMAANWRRESITVSKSEFTIVHPLRKTRFETGICNDLALP